MFLIAKDAEKLEPEVATSVFLGYEIDTKPDPSKPMD
jgi:hypothetical protein